MDEGVNTENEEIIIDGGDPELPEGIPFSADADTQVVPEPQTTFTFSGMNSPRCRQQILDFTTNRTLPPLFERQKVAQYIKRCQIDAMSEGKYKEAEKYYNLSHDFLDACKNAIDETGRKSEQEEYYQQIQQLEEQLWQINEQYKAQKRKLNEEKQKMSEKVQQTYQQKVESFIKKWESDNALVAYSKPSYQLTQLRDREKALIRNKEWKQAANLKEMADHLEEEETKKAQVRAQEACQKERDKIELDYQKQLGEVDRKLDYLKTRIDKRHKDMTYPINSRINKLQSDIKNASKSNANEIARQKNFASVAEAAASLTPRTRTKLKQIKERTLQSKLRLQGISNSASQRPPPKVHLVVPSFADSSPK